MTALVPEQEWWTAAQIAGSGLPDLPGTRQGVEKIIERLQWRSHPQLARRRGGKGGGWEYSWKLFPSRAQRKLVQAVAIAVQPMRVERGEAWRWYEALPASVKAKAAHRLLIIQKVEALEPVVGKFLAIGQLAQVEAVSDRTIWNWFGMIEGVRPDDRLAYLAPRHRAAPVRSKSTDFSPEFLAMLKSDFLRNAQPSFTSCYRRAIKVAKDQGWDVQPEHTMRRRFNEAVSQVTQVLARKGIDAVKRMYPAQVRDKTCLTALEAVNADFHKFDVFVRWPSLSGQNEPSIMRPQMVAFQDIYSGRILAWRLDQTANSTAVMLCAGDMIETWGIPEHVLFDNGREFAAKAITGGAQTRFRFKVREDDLPGLFTNLDCEIHWATPYSGQSKPIERAFRDMCDSIAKDPRFDGAWTGNRPEAQPEDYGSKAIDLDVFLAVLAEGIEEHNTRQGRRSEVAWGRSFAEVFDESYATAPIRKATEEQRRLWLLGAEGLRGDTKSGSIKFQGNEFWADWMHQIAGERVIARFDPADLWSGVHIYNADNAYLGHAPCMVKAGFFTMDEARSHQRARNAWLAAEKAAVKAHKTFRAADLGRMLDAAAPPDQPQVEAKVVRGIFGRANTDAPAVVPAATAPALPARVTDLIERRRAEAVEEAPRQRFRRALELERSGVMTVEQQRWLSMYQTTSEYRVERMQWDAHGDAIFG